MNQPYTQEQTLEGHKRKYSRDIAEHVVKKDTNLQIAGKNPRIKIKGQQTGKVKILQRHMQSLQIVVYIVIIVTKQGTQKTDVSRRKEK
jgi:hypothetical protein